MENENSFVKKTVIRIVLLFIGFFAVLSCMQCVQKYVVPEESDPNLLLQTGPVKYHEPGNTVVVGPAPKQDVEPLNSHEEKLLTSLRMGCGDDMLEVQGEYCSVLKETCEEWMSPEDTFRCKRFKKPSTCMSHIDYKRFCIDRYEFPNKKGTQPTVNVTWDDAQKSCNVQGKRLCKASEWTFACQGKDWKPYPYGFERNSSACRIDLGLAVPANKNSSSPSGSYDKCISDFGVYDLTGNVDEWVESDVGSASWLKGGWWGNLRNRCGQDATTKEHGKSYLNVQVGFRCCADLSK